MADGGRAYECLGGSRDGDVIALPPGEGQLRITHLRWPGMMISPDALDDPIADPETTQELYDVTWHPQHGYVLAHMGWK